MVLLSAQFILDGCENPGILEMYLLLRKRMRPKLILAFVMWAVMGQVWKRLVALFAIDSTHFGADQSQKKLLPGSAPMVVFMALSNFLGTTMHWSTA